MKMRTFGKLGIKASAFGLGCMRFPMTKDENGRDVVDEKTATEIIRTCIDNGVNYIDTAYVYSNGLNEKYVGKALRGGYREKVYLATKLPTWNCGTREDMYRLFEEQCQNLETDHIDFYLIHSLNSGSFEKMKNLGVFSFLDDLKTKGRIKYACFSFHDEYKVFEEIINSYDWDMCQLQFNYMDIDNQAGLRGVELAGSKGIPVVVMEGLLGGKLANVPDEIKEVFDSYGEKRSAAEWAFRWICDYPQVATVLSGVTNLEQASDNFRIFDNVEPCSMSEEERAIIDKAREKYRQRIKVDCTGCEYCLPCPKNVDIPRIFSIWNDSSMFGTKGNWRYKKLTEDGKGPENCVKCGKCMKVCPQHLKIPDLLGIAGKELQ